MHKPHGITLGLAAALVGGTFIGEATNLREKTRQKETCGYLAKGQNLASAQYTQKLWGTGEHTPELTAVNSIEALIGSCLMHHVIEASRACAAQSIMLAIHDGYDVPRPLVEDARATTQVCPAQ